jgi:hypothetical protein
MMVSAVVFTALRPLVADRVYPSTFLQPDGSLPVWPAICSTIYNVEPDVTICDDDAATTATPHAQIEVAAKSYGAMIALRNQIFAALANVDPPARCENYFDTYDTRSKTHRAVLDYTFHPSSQT